MRYLPLVFFVLALGCLGPGVKRAFEVRQDAISKELSDLQAKEQELRDQLAKGAVTPAAFDQALGAIRRDLERLQTADQSLRGEVTAARDQAKDLMLKPIYKGAAIAQKGAEIVGPWVDMLLPGAGYILGLIARALGGAIGALNGRSQS